MRSAKKQSENGSEADHCLTQKRNYRPISKETAKIIREIRKYMFVKTDEVWLPLKQFGFTFLGAFTFVVSLSLNQLFTTTIVTFQEIVSTFYLFHLVLVVFLSAFFGLMLAWVPRKTGPVRLYLSGLLLPALILFLVVSSMKYMSEPSRLE